MFYMKEIREACCLHLNNYNIGPVLDIKNGVPGPKNEEKTENILKMQEVFAELEPIEQGKQLNKYRLMFSGTQEECQSPRTPLAT